MYEVFRFVKFKIAFFFICTAAAFAFFHCSNFAIARDNAYLASFVDETSCMIKTQVLYSGKEVEATRMYPLATGGYDDANGSTNTDGSLYVPEFMLLKNENSRMKLKGSDGTFNQTSGGDGVVPWNDSTGTGMYVRFTINKHGSPSLVVAQNLSSTVWDKDTDVGSAALDVTDLDWDVLHGSDVLPMTFPADKDKDATNADINRAYEIQDVLTGDFQDALLFLNGGESYSSTEEMLEMAYGLVTASSTGVTKVTNSSGQVYQISYNKGSYGDDSNYTKTVTISEFDTTKAKGKATARNTYICRVKKGYLGCEYGQKTESGSVNTIALNDEDSKNSYDTTWISWEHLYLEACVLYSEGITYSNQADLYTVDELENSVVKLCRSLLNGLKGVLQMYSMEDLVFNGGIRAGRAFVYGAYYDNWSSFMQSMFLLSMSLALSVIMFNLITMVYKKQMALISPTSRYRMFEDVKQQFITVFFLSSVWWMMKLVLLLNYKLVAVFGAYVDGNTLQQAYGSSSVLAAVIYQFSFFVMDIYMNFLYITRGLFIAALIVLSPLFIIASNFGMKGRQITGMWIREFVGYVFIQSIHAFVYGFILSAAIGLRGIEGIIIYSSVVPLTGMVKNVFGLGLDNLTSQAAKLTQTGMGMGRGMVKMGAQMTAAAGGAVGGVAGSFIGGLSGGGGGLGGGLGGGAKMGGKIGSSLGGAAGNAIAGTMQLGNAFSSVGQELVTRENNDSSEGQFAAAGGYYANAIENLGNAGSAAAGSAGAGIGGGGGVSEGGGASSGSGGSDPTGGRPTTGGSSSGGGSGTSTGGGGVASGGSVNTGGGTSGKSGGDAVTKPPINPLPTKGTWYHKMTDAEKQNYTLQAAVDAGVVNPYQSTNGARRDYNQKMREINQKAPKGFNPSAQTKNSSNVINFNDRKNS